MTSFYNKVFMCFLMIFLISGCEKKNNTELVTNEVSFEENGDLLPYEFFQRADYDSAKDKEYIDKFQKLANEANVYELKGDRALVRRNKVWSNASKGASLDGNVLKIQVCWENSGHALGNALGDRGRKITRQAISETWERYARIKFEGWDTKCQSNSQGIRIIAEDLPNSFKDSKGNLVIGAPRTLGVGTQLDGVKNALRLNFKFDKWSAACKINEQKRDACMYSIAVHEFGHALGIHHEQTKLFTTELNTLNSGAKEYFRKKCSEQKVSEVNSKLRNNSPQTRNLYWWNAYDPNSVMNYCKDIYSAKVRLSQLDIDGVTQFYGRR